MPDLLATIKGDAERLKDQHRERNGEIDRMRKFRDGWVFDPATMQPISPTNTSEESRRWRRVVTDAPKNEVAFIVGLIGGSAVRHRIEGYGEDEAEKAKQSRVERFFWGVWNEADYWASLTELAPFDKLVTEGLCVDGIVYAFPWLRKGPGGKPEFRCRVFDPLNSYHEMGEAGIRTFINTYKVSAAYAQSMVEQNRNVPGWQAARIVKEHSGLRGWLEKGAKPQEEIEVIEWWQEEYAKEGGIAVPRYYHAVLMDETIAREKTDDGWKRMPIKITATTVSESADGKSGRRVESFLRGGLASTVHYNALMSDLHQMADMAARAPIIEESPSGVRTINPKTWGPGIVLGTTPGKKIYQLQLNYNLPSVIEAIAESNRERQKHFSDVNYAATPTPGSGFRFVQERKTAGISFQNLVDTKDFLTQQCDLEFLYQFQEAEWDAIELNGQEVRGVKKGAFFKAEFKKADMSKVHTIHVKTLVQNPIDPATQAIIVRQLTEGPVPALAMSTAREELLDVEDVQAEQRAVDKQAARAQAMNDPLLQSFGKVDGLMAESEALLIQASETESPEKQRLLRQKASRLRDRAIMVERQAMNMTSPGGKGVGTPSVPPGFDPSQVPPEAGAGPGAMADMMRAQAGVPPPGGNGAAPAQAAGG